MAIPGPRVPPGAPPGVVASATTSPLPTAPVVAGSDHAEAKRPVVPIQAVMRDPLLLAMLASCGALFTLSVLVVLASRVRARVAKHLLIVAARQRRRDYLDALARRRQSKKRVTADAPPPFRLAA